MRVRPSALDLRRGLGKRELRVAGIEAGASSRRHRHAPLVAPVVVARGRIEAVVAGRGRVDGDEIAERIARLVRRSGQLPGIRAVLLDRIA